MDNSPTPPQVGGGGGGGGLIIDRCIRAMGLQRGRLAHG